MQEWYRSFGGVMVAIATLTLASTSPASGADGKETAVASQHDYSLADTPNKRTALAYLYTAWNDGSLEEARRLYGAPGAFDRKGPPGPPPELAAELARSGPPKIRYTMRKVIEEGDQVVVLAFVEGVGVGKPVTTLFGAPGGIKIGDAVVEIFRFAADGRIARKWDVIEPLTQEGYDFQ